MATDTTTHGLFNRVAGPSYSVARALSIIVRAPGRPGRVTVITVPAPRGRITQAGISNDRLRRRGGLCGSLSQTRTPPLAAAAAARPASGPGPGPPAGPGRLPAHRSHESCRPQQTAAVTGGGSELRQT